MPTLTVQNAEIKTATVEVKTLTISGKQVTLAVFRQLQRSAWIDADGNPRGQGWGRVNYCPDRKCGYDEWGDYREHVHVVWQHGAELRRSTIREPGAWYSDEAARTRARAAWSTAWQLPQLFIAV